MGVRVRFAKGAVGAMHHHVHEQFTVVISGRFRFTVDGKDIEILTGDSLMIRSNQVHGAVALEAGELLDIFNPIREDFLDQDILDARKNLTHA
jgi:quercetin dioxygenase-like cupin family protein